tara:strand:- start:412 stop:891 length:480 start_codon:yes stop_codon:yes gene_type:complete
MKTFNQFQENAAALAALKGGSKFILPALMTGIGAVGTLYQASKKNGGSNFEKLRQQQQKGEGEDLKKKAESDAEKPSTREKIKNALVDAGLRYKKGLSAGKEVESTSSTGRISSVSDEFRKKEGGKSPAQTVRELLKRQNQNMKDKRAINKQIDKDLGK